MTHASGTVSASLDWNPTSTTGTWSGTIAAGASVDQPIVVSAPGPLTAGVSWSCPVLCDPIMRLDLVDDHGTTLQTSGSIIAGCSASISYTVPSTISFAHPATWHLVVTASLYYMETGTNRGRRGVDEVVKSRMAGWPPPASPSCCSSESSSAASAP